MSHDVVDGTKLHDDTDTHSPLCTALKRESVEIYEFFILPGQLSRKFNFYFLHSSDVGRRTVMTLMKRLFFHRVRRLLPAASATVEKVKCVKSKKFLDNL